MHIPQGDTAAMEILSFEEAAERSTSEDYDRDKWLYVPDFYTEYRYVLGTRGEYPVICAGINPSTAEPDNLDPTLKSVSRIAAANAFDSWMMFNVYAQRATRPDDMDTERNELLHHENMEAFRALLQLAETLLAYGLCEGHVHVGRGLRCAVGLCGEVFESRTSASSALS